PARPALVPPQPDSLKMQAQTGQFAVSSFSLGNAGSLPLAVSITAEPWLAVDPSIVTVASSTVEDFLVTATCGAEEGIYDGTIMITSNDSGSPSTLIAVSLECIAPPPSGEP